MTGKYIPKSLRAWYNRFRQLRKNTRWKNVHASKNNGENHFPYSIPVFQPIYITTHSANKIVNLRIAASCIHPFIIRPGEVISFWNCIGYPSVKKGYKKGRNIINGKLQEDTGGGLCQLSGITYHTALLAGLEILERHPHSLDIYTEEERYTPLGSDATVVYGIKDLVCKNPFPFPVQFSYDVTEDEITCRLQSAEYIPERKVLFRRTDTDVCKKVELVQEEFPEHILATSFYKSPQVTE